jgi:hyperosmotically inducible protein
MNASKLNVVALAALLSVAGSARPIAAAQAAGEKTDNHVVQAKDAVVKGAKVVGTKTKDGLSKSGEVMTDEWITARVHQRFVGDDLLKDSDISVDSSHHVVTLTGTVIGLSGRSRATRIAIGTEGVQRVINRLTMGPKQKTKT